MRLSALDAMNYYYSLFAKNLEAGDMCSLMAIDSGAASPAFTEIRDAIAARMALIPALQERIAHAPGDFTFPHWVADPQPIADKFTERTEPTWADVLDTCIGISNDNVDPMRSTWRAVLWRDVTGVPDVEGKATILYMQVAHCVTDGQGITQVQRAIFGDDAALGKIPGHGNPTSNLGLADAGMELAQVPWNLFNGFRAARAARSAPSDSNGFTMASVPALNGLGERRAFGDISLVDLASLRWAGTVTETGLTAVSAAIEAYLAEVAEAEGPLYAQIPVVPAGTSKLKLPVPSGNSVSSSVYIDLGIGAGSRTERYETIHASLAKGLSANAGDGHLARRQLFERLPVQTVRTAARNAISAAPNYIPSHTGLTSYTKGKADLTLLGGRVVFLAGFPILRPHIGVSQVFIGLGDRVAVCVSASDSFERPERYVELLHAAIKREI